MSFCTVKLGERLKVDVRGGVTGLHVLGWHKGDLVKKIVFSGRVITLHPSNIGNGAFLSGYDKIFINTEDFVDISILNEGTAPFSNMEFEEEFDVETDTKSLSHWGIKIDPTNTVYITVIIEDNTGGGRVRNLAGTISDHHHGSSEVPE